MNRAIARALHETMNASYWMENPDWRTDSRVSNFALDCLRKLPFSVHEMQKKILLREHESAIVSGESIVLPAGDMVHKYMFRYPKHMDLQSFYSNVSREVGAVTSRLATVAIPTTVDIERADIFRRPFGPVYAATQTQQRLDLEQHPPLDLTELRGGRQDHTTERTARHLEALLTESRWLLEDDGLYPDVARASHNLRRNKGTGEVTLIDVMPLREDGTRLVGDTPSKLPAALEALDEIETYVGEFGA